MCCLVSMFRFSGKTMHKLDNSLHTKQCSGNKPASAMYPHLTASYSSYTSFLHCYRQQPNTPTCAVYHS